MLVGTSSMEGIADELLPFGEGLFFDHPGKNKIASGVTKCGVGDSNEIVTIKGSGGVGSPRGCCQGRRLGSKL